MNRLCIFLCSCLVAAEVSGEEKPASKERAPFVQDQYSGQTITDVGMASDIVIHRFYNTPCYGTKAPIFVLPDLESGKSVQLEELHAEKPVVLFFASYGCDLMRDGISELLAIYEENKEHFDFAMIYIREAHSLDGLHPHLAKVKDPKTGLERRKAAELCDAEFSIPFRILLDHVDDRVATRWGAWPIRLFVVDTRGTVIYSGKPGPWGFNPGKGFAADGSESLRPHADRFNQESLEDFLSKYRKPND